MRAYALVPHHACAALAELRRRHRPAQPGEFHGLEGAIRRARQHLADRYVQPMQRLSHGARRG